MHACPDMTWSHSAIRDMEAVINGSGTIRVRVQDLLVTGVKSIWSGTSSFSAEGRNWVVFYHKRRAENSRVFTGESVDAEGCVKRVILYYGEGGDLAHGKVGYEKNVLVGIKAIIRQLGG